MKEIVVNRFVGPEPTRYAHVIRGNHNHPRINTYNITDASLVRVERLAISKKTNRYDGEPGRGYCLQTEYKF